MKLALPCFVVVVLLALVLGRFGVARLPQVVQGDDALSVAFGDAKSTISAAMVHKADSYFHGGIDMECKEHHDHHDHHHDDHDHDQSSNPPIPQSSNPPIAHSHTFDLWGWINQHVRAPEKHVHLEGEKSVELMPWFWALLSASSGNLLSISLAS